MATVWTQTLTLAEMGTLLIPYLRDNFTWAGGTETASQYTYFYINEAKTIGIRYFQGINGIYGSKIAVIFKDSYYHETEFYPNGTFEIEITATALILSYISNSNSISASNCEKIIVHNAINPKTNTTQQVISYIGNKSSSNVFAMYTSDILTPVDMPKQNGGANVSSAQSVFIPLCNKATDFIATDVYECLCSSLSGWSFGNSIIDGHKYRMSGSIYALDE